MGLFLDKPKKEKERDSGEGNGLRYAVCAMQGWRVDMEDSHSVKLELAPWLKDFSYFAVFDGHAGDFVSKYCASNLLEEIIKGVSSTVRARKRPNDVEPQPMETDQVDDEASSLPKSADSAPASEHNSISLKEGTDDTTLSKSLGDNSHAPIPGSVSDKETVDSPQTENVDRNPSELMKLEKEGHEKGRDCTTVEDKNDNETMIDLNLKSVISQGFLDMDERLKNLPEFNSGEERSGSTAVAVFVSPKQYIFANCGDSRALLCRNGKPFFVTQDHKPYNEGEKTRIENAGGSVIIQRVNGSLAVSRSLGDFDYKRVPNMPCTAQLVSAEPELSFVDRAEDDEFLVLACDGVWDVMSNQDVVDYVQSRLKVHHDLDSVCDDLLETCLAKGSKDNMSVIIVTFPGAPAFSKEAAEKEVQINGVIRGKVEDVIKKNEGNPLDIETVFDALQEQEIEGLPPGGGLQAKFPFIEQCLEELLPENMKNENQRYAGSIPVPLSVVKQFAGDPGVSSPEEAEGPAS